MKIIALSGWKRSGKDTAAELLVKEYGYTAVSFAGVLKDMVAEEYGIPREWCDDPRYKEAPLKDYPAIPKDPFTEAITGLLKAEINKGYWTPRALCILKGSVNRAVSSKFWTSRAIKHIQVGQKLDIDKYVITDLRYKSEVEDLHDSFGSRLSTIRINRFDTISTTDPSERNLDNYKFDYIVENKKTIEDFKQDLRGVMEDVKCRKG